MPLRLGLGARHRGIVELQRVVRCATVFTCFTYLLFDSIRQGGPTRTSADVSVPRLAGFSLIPDPTFRLLRQKYNGQTKDTQSRYTVRPRGEVTRSRSQSQHTHAVRYRSEYTGKNTVAPSETLQALYRVTYLLTVSTLVSKKY